MKQVISFLIVFFLTFLCLMAYDHFSKSSVEKKILQDVLKTKIIESEINGVKVQSRNGVKNISADEFIKSIKTELRGNGGKVIHESAKGNRYYITYLSEEKQHSFILQATSDKSCRYMHFTTPDKNLPKYNAQTESKTDFLIPPNSQIILNMNGGNGKSLVSFTTELLASEVELFYVNGMIDAGWRREDADIPSDLELPSPNGSSEAKSMYFMKDKTPMVISITDDPSSQARMVFLIKG